MGTNVEVVVGWDWIIFVDAKGKDLLAMSAEDVYNILTKK